MKSTEASPQTTTTKFDGVLVTIRSRKSFFEVIRAIEKALPRFHIPKLMEYVTHGDRGCRSLRRVHFRSLLYLL